MLIKDQIIGLLKKTAATILPDEQLTDIKVEYPSELSHGDYSTNIALAAAKKMSMKPREVADKIVTALNETADPVRAELIEKIEIFRNGELLHTLNPNVLHLDFTFDDPQMIDQVALSAPEEAPSFVYYYIRVFQKDGHIAWSSPIWVDLLHDAQTSVAPRKAKKKS